MSMEWFRWHNGTVTDPKLALIAKKSEQSRPVVLAVWAALLEQANQAEDRGDITDFDLETIAVALDIEEDAIHAVIGAMSAKGMIKEGRLTAWDKRQPVREDATVSARVQAYRERKRQEETTSNDTKRDETHGNAAKRNETPVTPLDSDTDTDTDKPQTISDHRENSQPNAAPLRGLDTQARPTTDVVPTPTPTIAEPLPAEPDPPPAEPLAASGYPPAFEALWADYPIRNGGNPKIKAFRAWNARIADGHSAAEMHDGTRRYAAWCAAGGKLNTEYVQQASTFLGPQKGFAEPWTPPADTPGRHGNDGLTPVGVGSDRLKGRTVVEEIMARHRRFEEIHGPYVPEDGFDPFAASLRPAQPALPRPEPRLLEGEYAH